MPRYAQRTEVGSEQSRLEIERVLRRYGADQFMSGWGKTGAVIGFRMNGRMFRLNLPLPPAEAFRFSPDRGLQRGDRAMYNAYEQATRQRWRALLLVVKAQLEAVDAGIVTVEEAFLGAVMLPNGETVQEWVQPQVAEAYASGRMPDTLPGLSAPLTKGALGSGT